MTSLLSVDRPSATRRTLLMGLSDRAHVEVAFILRRLLDNRTDQTGPDAAREWVHEHWPSIEVYRKAEAEGAKPLPVLLSHPMRRMLSDALYTELDVGGGNPSARGLVRRGLAEWTGPGRLRLTEWGVEIAKEQRGRGST